jgi:hypothetical protein
MEQTQCSETSDIKHHTPENNPKGYTRNKLLWHSSQQQASHANKFWAKDIETVES